MEKGSDIQSYFEEIAAALIDLQDSEDDSRALLAKNALEEVRCCLHASRTLYHIK
jgi:hypothetical protein